MRASSSVASSTASLVGHLPDLVALEAEVLDPEAGRARSDHARAPGAEVLDAAGTRPRVVEVDPVVRERLGLVVISATRHRSR